MTRSSSTVQQCDQAGVTTGGHIGGRTSIPIEGFWTNSGTKGLYWEIKGPVWSGNISPIIWALECPIETPLFRL